MEPYLYLDNKTFYHNLHPVTKIFCLLLLFILTMIFNHPVYVSIVMIFVISIIVISKSFQNLVRIKTILILLFLFCSILWTFFLKGSSVLWKLGIITIYKESLFYAIAMGLRLDTILLCGMIFLSTTRIEEFSAGLNKLGMPFPISFALSLAFRLVPTFSATTETVGQAQKSRGLDLESGWIGQRLKKHIPMIIPIFIYAVRNADLLAMALESKAFGIRKDRTYYLYFNVTIVDYMMLMFFVIINAVCLYLRLKGYGVVIDRL
ncbi:MAG: energy-coupling factor transporter transmembrane component T family protein [Candidatus Poribacteria bacterium]